MSNLIKDAHIVIRCLAGWSSRDIAKEFGVSRQAIAKHIERLQPVIDLETRAIVRRMAKSQSRQLGLLPLPRPKPKTIEEILERPSPAAVASAVLWTLGHEGAAEVARRINRSLADRRYRQRVKARAKAMKEVLTRKIA